jgi:hypothetical protein
VRLIENTLASINPFVQNLYINRTSMRTEPNIQLELRIVGRKENDPRTYNRPTASEVAALVPTSLSAAGKTRNVIIFPTSGDQTFISAISRGSTSLFAIPCCVLLARLGGATGAAPQYTMQPAPLAPRPDDGGDANVGKRMRRTRTTRSRGEEVMVLRVSRSSSGSDMLLKLGSLSLRCYRRSCYFMRSVLTPSHRSRQTVSTSSRNNQDAIHMIKASGLLDAAAGAVRRLKGRQFSV